MEDLSLDIRRYLADRVGEASVRVDDAGVVRADPADPGDLAW